MPQYKRVYKGVDSQLSDDWADYWEREAMLLEDLKQEKRVLLHRTFKANRQNDLIVNNVKFSVHKPKMIRDQAVHKYEQVFDRMAPTMLKVIPRSEKLVIDYKQIERDLGLNCPRTPLEYRGTSV